MSVFCCEDVLLCHDDELDSRRVAFALYLTPSWSQQDGGLLDVFDSDGLYASSVLVDMLDCYL